MAEEIFKTIFQMDADNTKLLASLDEVNKRYVQQTANITDQQKKLQELQAQEEKLIAARSNASNPTSVVKYNQKIAETRAEIAKTTEEVNKLNTAEGRLTDATKKFGKDLGVAFDSSKVNSLRKEVTQLGQQISNSGRAFDEPIKKTESLRAQLRKVREELANIGDDDEEFIRLSIAAGKLEDKISDAREAARIFASDSPLQSFGIALKSVIGDLASLNFKDASEKSKLLVKASQQITFKSSVEGIKQLGTTLANVGRALLTNPIFLIGTAVALIIANFGKLKNAGGLIGTVFIAIGRAIDVVIRAGKDLLDFLGLIDATKKSLEELIAFNDDLIASYENYYKSRIAILNAGNKRVIELENEQAAKILAVNKQQTLQILADFKEKGSTADDYYEAIRKLQENGAKANDVYTANVVRNTELQIKGEDKLRDLRLKNADQRQKNKEQVLGFSISKDAPELIKKLTDLQIKELDRAEKEEKRIAERELVNTKVVGSALYEIGVRFNLQRVALKAKEVKDLFDLDVKLANERIELEKTKSEELSNIALTYGSFTEEQVAEAKVDILLKYYKDKEDLLKKNIKDAKEKQLESLTFEKELSALKLKFTDDVSKAIDDRDKLKKQLRLAEFDEESRHQLALFDIAKINETKISEILKQQGSKRTQIEIENAEARLKIIKASNEKVVGEEEKAQNEINELRAKKGEEEKEERKQRIIEILDGIKQVTDATFAAFNQQIAAEIAFSDKKIGLQQQRIDEAKQLADKGNAELLELEKKRLDDLNTEKEKYVRRQQSLIAIELVANSALAIAKAAAQGGVAAPFTIAATLIALVAGLAQAKSVAEQAAFYDGGMFNGEGYTGNGNPREESKGVGNKPYTYHKEEFIFNHKTTRKFKDIFHDIHKGNIDLKDWQQKVTAFEMIKNNPMGMVVNENGDLVVLNSKLDKVISAIEGQKTSVSLDGSGFSMYLKNIQSRNDFIKNNLARR